LEPYLANSGHSQVVTTHLSNYELICHQLQGSQLDSLVCPFVIYTDTMDVVMGVTQDQAMCWSVLVESNTKFALDQGSGARAVDSPESRSSDAVRDEDKSKTGHTDCDGQAELKEGCHQHLASSALESLHQTLHLLTVIPHL
jgi:hypothetical protein